MMERAGNAGMTQRLLCDLSLARNAGMTPHPSSSDKTFAHISKRKSRHLGSVDCEYVQLKSLDIIGPYPGSQFAIHNLPHSHTLPAKNGIPRSISQYCRANHNRSSDTQPPLSFLCIACQRYSFSTRSQTDLSLQLHRLANSYSLA